MTKHLGHFDSATVRLRNDHGTVTLTFDTLASVKEEVDAAFARNQPETKPYWSDGDRIIAVADKGQVVAWVRKSEDHWVAEHNEDTLEWLNIINDEAASDIEARRGRTGYKKVFVTRANA